MPYSIVLTVVISGTTCAVVGRNRVLSIADLVPAPTVKNSGTLAGVVLALVVNTGLATSTGSPIFGAGLRRAAAILLVYSCRQHVSNFTGLLVLDQVVAIADGTHGTWRSAAYFGVGLPANDARVTFIQAGEVVLAELLSILDLLIKTGLAICSVTAAWVDMALALMNRFRRIAITGEEATAVHHAIRAVLNAVAGIPITAIARAIAVLAVLASAIARRVEVDREAAAFGATLLAGRANVFGRIAIGEFASILEPLVRVLIALTCNRLTLLNPGLSPGGAKPSVTLDVRDHPTLVGRSTAV